MRLLCNGLSRGTLPVASALRRGIARAAAAGAPDRRKVVRLSAHRLDARRRARSGTAAPMSRARSRARLPPNLHARRRPERPARTCRAVADPLARVVCFAPRGRAARPARIAGSFLLPRLRAPRPPSQLAQRAAPVFGKDPRRRRFRIKNGRGCGAGAAGSVRARDRDGEQPREGSTPRASGPPPCARRVSRPARGGQSI